MIESLARLQIVFRTIDTTHMRTREGGRGHKAYLPCKWKSCLSLLSDTSLKVWLKKRRSLSEES